MNCAKSTNNVILAKTKLRHFAQCLPKQFWPKWQHFDEIYISTKLIHDQMLLFGGGTGLVLLVSGRSSPFDKILHWRKNQIILKIIDFSRFPEIE